MPEPKAAPLRLGAPAKINLGLEVVGRRDDGYHELVTIFQTLELADTVAVAPASATLVACDVPMLAGRANLAWRAAELYEAEYGAGAPRAAIAIEKRIPVAGGLGGGSSDAAAALAGLNALASRPLEEERLLALAARLGADVPFLLRGGCALATGRGDALEPLPGAPRRGVVLVAPPGEAPERKTALLYGRLERRDFSDGRRTRAAAVALRAGAWPDEGLLVNAFDRVAEGLFPALATTRARAAAILGRRLHLSGSGPTLYALVEDPGAAAERLRSAGLEARGTWAVAAWTGERIDQAATD